jgi:hypothetical protein
MFCPTCLPCLDNMFRHVWQTCLANFANVFGVFGLWVELVAHVWQVAPTCSWLLASCANITENENSIYHRNILLVYQILFWKWELDIPPKYFSGISNFIFCVFEIKPGKCQKYLWKKIFFPPIFSGIPTFCNYSREKQLFGFCNSGWDKIFFWNFSQKKPHVFGVRARRSN